MHVIANIFLLWSRELALKGSNLGIAQAGGILFLGILPYRQFNLVLECHGDSFGQSSSVCQWGQGCGFVKILRTITSKLTGSSRRRSPPNHSQDGLSFAGSCNSVIIRLPKSDKKMPCVFFSSIIRYNPHNYAEFIIISHHSIQKPTKSLPRRLRSCPRIAKVHRANEQDVLEALESSSLKAGWTIDSYRTQVGIFMSLQVLEVEGNHFVTRPQPLPPLEAKRPELLHKSVDGEEEPCWIIVSYHRMIIISNYFDINSLGSQPGICRGFHKPIGMY